MDQTQAECSKEYDKSTDGIKIRENEPKSRDIIVPAYNTIQIQTSLSPSVQRVIQNCSMAFITLQQSVNPLMVRHAHKLSELSGAQFLSSTTVFTTEIMRIVMCCVLLCISSGSILSFLHDLRNTFLRNKFETVKVCIPALIYVVQNNLYFFALKRVDATLFSISYQLRILTTAVLSKLLLGRIFSNVQWGSLLLSFVGVILVQLSSSAKLHSPMTHAAMNASTIAEAGLETRMAEYDENIIGLITVFAMCWTSAFAGVYLEGVLKKSSCDILMQNIRLSVITLPFAVLTMANDREIIENYGIYYGWSWMVWTVAFSSAVGGIVVAAVMKYADNIRKSYCQSIALGGTALLSITFGDSHFSFILAAGVSLVIASVFLYTLYPPIPPSHEPLGTRSSEGQDFSLFSDSDDDEEVGTEEDDAFEVGGTSCVERMPRPDPLERNRDRKYTA